MDWGDYIGPLRKNWGPKLGKTNGRSPRYLGKPQTNGKTNRTGQLLWIHRVNLRSKIILTNLDKQVGS